MKLTSIITLAALAAGVILFGSMSCNYRNGYVRQENAIGAQIQEEQNVLTTVSNSLTSQGLNANEYKGAVMEAIVKAISGRYGEGGAKQAILFIKEDNPKIDPSLYNKLAIAIEAGYLKFEAAQRKKIDLVRIYKNDVQQFPGNIFAGMFGYPLKPWEEMEKIIVSGFTKQTFDSGILAPIDPNAANKKP